MRLAGLRRAVAWPREREPASRGGPLSVAPARRPAPGRRASAALAALGVAILLAVAAAGSLDRRAMPRLLTDAELRRAGAYMFDSARELPEFALLDHHGERFDRQSLRGRWTLLFFGFSRCPDVCPTTMALLGRFAETLRGLPEQADTQVVMVSVDPARDRVAELARYVPRFNPEFLGVTGELADIQRLAAALATPFHTLPGQGRDYQMEHGAELLLINPRGEFHGFFKAPLELSRLGPAYRSVRAAWG